jgi:hypothetical protein
MKRKTVARKKVTAKRKVAKPRVPEKQWEMPAGFQADGKSMATLKDVVDPHKPTMQLTNLPFDKRAALVVERLNRQPQFELNMIGAGKIDKARAITEVKNHTKVGRLLVEIEHQMIRNLIEHAEKQAAAKKTKPK